MKASTRRNYRNVLAQVKEKLPDFLRSYNREPNAQGKFHCVNPEHEDKDPSCGFVPGTDQQVFKCFACGHSGDIFNAAHLLESRPLHGAEFLTENLFPLAERYSIPHEGLDQLDEGVRKQSEIFRAYQTAASILAFSEDDSLAKSLYNWNLKETREVEPYIGTVEWKPFAKEMRSRGGYTQVYLETIGIKPVLFDSHLLTFALKNHLGKVIGFAARDSRHGENNRIQKWRNTSNEVPIFDKSKMLYGMDVAAETTGPLYLVEGYSDVIELRLRGMRNVVAYCGSTIGHNQAQELRARRKMNIILCPDRDKNEAGDKGMMQTLKKHLFEIPDLTIAIKTLPLAEEEESNDPASYVNAKSLDQFLALDELDAFDWYMERVDTGLPVDELVSKNLLPIVVQEADAIRREVMLKKIAKRVDIRLGALQQQLDDEMADKKQQNYRNAMREVDRLRTKLETAQVDEIPALLRESALSVEATQNTKFSTAAHGVQETVTFVQDLKREFEHRGTGLPGWLTGFREIDEALGGIPVEESMMTVAGDGNVGKSCIVQNIGLKVALNNPDAAVMLYTIDDTRKQTIPRLISQMTGIPINIISQPLRYQLTEEQEERVAQAWNSLRTIVQEGRFDLKDASQGQDVEFARKWIEHVQANQPDKRILFILDNFHRLRVGRQGIGSGDDRARLEAASDAVFNFTKQLGISALCTMELRKRENIAKRPRIEDLKGSKRFEYDNSVIAMVHCQMHATPDASDVECWEENQVRKPILQLWFDKNKVTSFKGMVRMKLRPECAQVLDADDDTHSTEIPVLPDE